MVSEDFWRPYRRGVAPRKWSRLRADRSAVIGRGLPSALLSPSHTSPDPSPHRKVWGPATPPTPTPPLTVRARHAWSRFAMVGIPRSELQTMQFPLTMLDEPRQFLQIRKRLSESVGPALIATALIDTAAETVRLRKKRVSLYQ